MEFDEEKLEKWLEKERAYRSLADHKRLREAGQMLDEAKHQTEVARAEFLAQPQDPMKLYHFVRCQALVSKIEAMHESRLALSAIVVALEIESPTERAKFLQTLI